MMRDLALEKAAGAASAAHALLIEAHAALRPEALEASRTLDAVGAALVFDLPPAPLRADALDRTLAALSDRPPASQMMDIDADSAFPAPVRAALSASRRSLRWRTVMPGMRTFDLDAVSDSAAKAQLIKLQRGRIIPRHAHEGDELTLVISGSFSDDHGRYAAGDLMIAEPGSEHEPRVSDDGDCICLAVTTGPLRMRSPIAGVVRYLLS